MVRVAIIGASGYTGVESIEILLQVMENNRDDLVVILAGYKDKMGTFFHSNPGMRSRIAHHIDFPDYSADELLAIAKLMLAEQNYRLSEDATKALLEYIHRRKTMVHFANARSIRNALDRARLRQANRLFADAKKSLKKVDLMTIEAEEFLASRVFQEGTLDLDGDGAPTPPSRPRPNETLTGQRNPSISPCWSTNDYFRVSPSGLGGTRSRAGRGCPDRTRQTGPTTFRHGGLGGWRY